MGFKKDGRRFYCKSAQLEIIDNLMWKFQQLKALVLVVTPEIFSLIGRVLPDFSIQPNKHLN
jgi:hypothetical protein